MAKFSPLLGSLSRCVGGNMVMHDNSRSEDIEL
jgi:hypothetical protein